MASKAHGGLGKGLGALLKNTKITPDKDKVQELDEREIRANRYQPRQEFDESALETLKDSVKRIGIIEPLLVRRLRAARLAGLRTVPAMVREYNDAEASEIALIENIQREDLNTIEEARAYQRLMKDFGLTQDDMAKKIGRSRSHIANFLRLLKLEAQVQEYVAGGTLSMGQAKPLLALENPQLQREAAEYIRAEDLSARQSEALARKLQENPAYLKEKNPQGKAAGKEQDVFLADAAERLTHLFGTQVKIQPGRKKSRIEIEFYSAEDLERIMETILNPPEHPKAVRQQNAGGQRNVFQSQKFTV